MLPLLPYMFRSIFPVCIPLTQNFKTSFIMKVTFETLILKTSNMRTNFRVLCVVLAMSAYLFGCSNSDDIISGGPQKSKDMALDMPDQFKIIGEKHNEGLNYAFDQLRIYYEQSQTRSNGKIRKLSKKAYLGLMEKACQQYCVDNVNGYTNAYKTQTVSFAKTRSEVLSAMSPDIVVFVDKIKDALKNNPKTAEQLLDRLNIINKEAASALTGMNLAAVYAGTSTCYYSYIYWKENHMKWRLAVTNPKLLRHYSDEQLNAFVIKNGKLTPPSVTRGFWGDAWNGVTETWDSVTDSVSDWWDNGGEDVVGADASGAVIGAISGGTVGSAAGGVGAVPGAVVGGISGGASSSAGEIIEQLI